MIQLIDKQGKMYRLKINENDYLFSGICLWKDGIIPLKAGLNNGSLCWNMGKGKISYLQIKKAMALIPLNTGNK